MPFLLPAVARCYLTSCRLLATAGDVGPTAATASLVDLWPCGQFCGGGPTFPPRGAGNLRRTPGRSYRIRGNAVEVAHGVGQLVAHSIEAPWPHGVVDLADARSCTLPDL